MNHDGLSYERLAYSIEEAATLLSLSRSQMYRLLDLGELEAVKIGKSRRITRRQLETFLRRLEQSGGVLRLL